MKGLTHADYLKQLREPASSSILTRRIGAHLHQLYSSETKKTGLTSADDKRFIMPDMEHTLAYGHPQIPDEFRGWEHDQLPSKKEHKYIFAKKKKPKKSQFLELAVSMGHSVRAPIGNLLAAADETSVALFAAFEQDENFTRIDQFDDDDGPAGTRPLYTAVPAAAKRPRINGEDEEPAPRVKRARFIVDDDDAPAPGRDDLISLD